MTNSQIPGEMDQRKRTKLIVRLVIACGLIVFLYFIVHGTLQQKQFEFMVCVNFQGNTHCATSMGLTREEAIRSAQEIDCSQLSYSRDTNMACLALDPTRIEEVKK